MIRQATETDFHELAEFYHDANLVAHPFIDPEFIVRDQRRFRNEVLPLNEAFLYEEHGQILGFVSLTRDHINGLFVRADYQRQGIGQALLNHVKRRHEKLELCCFIDNYEAQRFYHAQSFEVVQAQPNDRVPHDEYLMRWSA